MGIKENHVTPTHYLPLFERRWLWSPTVNCLAGPVRIRVWLKNNDRLTGEIRYLESSSLVIKTPSARYGCGQVGIPSKSGNDATARDGARKGDDTIDRHALSGEEGNGHYRHRRSHFHSSIHSLARPGAWLDSWVWDGDLDIDLDAQKR